ncbi:FAD-dependent oxidoreductase [Desulfovibrio sp. OttesenSCG-928-O18]|nr:FAD-dependent oxidoreductase [Desulfovibrio sp. OttesenSCG-928-O18]
MTKKMNVVVVGGGVSGMTSALILARFGHEVTLVERSPVLGMTIRGFFRQGVYFDTGFHYTGGLGEDGPLGRYLCFLGLSDLPVTAFEPDGFNTIRFIREGRDIRLSAGFDATKDRLLSLFPGEDRVINDYFAEVRKVFLASPFLNTATDVREVFAEESRYDTLAEFLAGRTNDPVLRATLSIHSLLHGTPPEEVSFLQHARVVASCFRSAHTFAGGGRTLAEGFERRLGAEGVRIVRGSGVSRINFSPIGEDLGDAIAGVTLEDGSMLDADTVVYTAHPFYLPDLVPQGKFKPSFSHRIHSLEGTPSAYMLFGISEQPLPPLEGSNLFLCPDTDISAFFKPGRDVSNGPFYVTTSPRGDADAPGYGVTVVGPGDFSEYTPWENTLSGRRGSEYAAFKAKKLEQFRKALVAASPEFSAVRFIDGATPLTFRDFIHSPAGSLYGCRHTLTQYSPQPMTSVPGLWLAGQSVLAPGVLGAVVSAFLTCGFMVGQEALREELVACG